MCFNSFFNNPRALFSMECTIVRQDQGSKANFHKQQIRNHDNPGEFYSFSRNLFQLFPQIAGILTT